MCVHKYPLHFILSTTGSLHFSVLPISPFLLFFRPFSIFSLTKGVKRHNTINHGEVTATLRALCSLLGGEERREEKRREEERRGGANGSWVWCTERVDSLSLSTRQGQAWMGEPPFRW